jgi:hypothetical protein
MTAEEDEKKQKCREYERGDLKSEEGENSQEKKK